MLGAAWIAIKAMGIWSRMGAWFSTLGTWAARNPWPALAIVLALVNVVPLVVHKHDAAQIATDKINLAAINAAQATAGQAAVAARNAEQAAYQAKATEADNDHTTLAAGSAGAADQFIATHGAADCRVQPAPAGGAGGKAPATPEGSNPGVPSGVPAGPVLVSPEDVRACTGAVDYAIAAHQWADTLNAP